MVNSAIICEGTAEEVVINLLLDNNKLIIKREELIEGGPLKTRGADDFQRKHLRKRFNNKIKIYRILDSHTESFKLKSPYNIKAEVINVVTAPEIEMLVIHGEKKYDDYKKSKKKPSEFCKQDLKMPDIKKEGFLKNYFKDIDKLIDCIKIHRKKAKRKNNEKFLAEILAES